MKRAKFILILIGLLSLLLIAATPPPMTYSQAVNFARVTYLRYRELPTRDYTVNNYNMMIWSTFLNKAYVNSGMQTNDEAVEQNHLRWTDQLPFPAQGSADCIDYIKLSFHLQDGSPQWISALAHEKWHLAQGPIVCAKTGAERAAELAAQNVLAYGANLKNVGSEAALLYRLRRSYLFIAFSLSDTPAQELAAGAQAGLSEYETKKLLTEYNALPAGAFTEYYYEVVMVGIDASDGDPLSWSMPTTTQGTVTIKELGRYMNGLLGGDPLPPLDEHNYLPLIQRKLR